MHTLPRRLSLPALLLAALVAGPLTLLGCDAADPGASSTLTADVPLASAAAKSDVCHYDADAGTYHLINVADASLPAHLDHGDASPGEEVPGTDGAYIFDGACQPVSLCPFEGGERFEGTLTLASALVFDAEVTIRGCPDPGGVIADVVVEACTSNFVLLQYTETGFLVQEDGSTPPGSCADGYEFDFVYDESTGSLVGPIVGYLGGPSDLSGTFELDLVP